MELIPEHLSKEISLHIESVKKNLHQCEADALIVASNANIYYTSGRFFRGYVYIPVDSDPIWFVIRPSSYEQAENVFNIRKPEDIPTVLEYLGTHVPHRLALELDVLSYSEITRLKNLFPHAELKNGSKALSEARMIKTEWEIEQMKEDGRLQVKTYKEVPQCYSPGISDLKLQIEIEYRLRLNGALGISRTAGKLMDINMGSVISGDNADVGSPYDFTMGGAGMDGSNPVGAADKEILPGQTVMIDMNGVFNGYQTDMTRVWKLGEISDLAQKAHHCSMEILHTLEKEGVPGVRIGDLYDKAVDIVTKHELSDYYMGHSSQVSFIGHGVGIELNEPPVIMKRNNSVLKENMTLAIEPKFVIPGVGAVGVENTYRVTASGLENLTPMEEEIMNL